MGAWIEIFLGANGVCLKGSHPTWVRGLKSAVSWTVGPLPVVAPYMGAWIEIAEGGGKLTITAVAPYMGAWIEISKSRCKCCRIQVAPYMGAWIEITCHH